MTIEKSFDGESREILRADGVIDRIKDFPKVAVTTWSQGNVDLFMETTECTEAACLDFGQSKTPVYIADDGSGIRFALYFSHLGGPAAAAQMEEVIAMGAEKFLCFGSCGCLDENIEAGSIVVPTKAFRDEGTSYHYLPARDFVDIKTSGIMAERIRNAGVEPVVTKVWTTDALYRETEGRTEYLKSLGCGAVDMECASLAAVAEFRNVQFSQFFYIEDNLGGEEWDPGLLGKFTAEHRAEYKRLIMEILREMQV